MKRDCPSREEARNAARYFKARYGLGHNPKVRQVKLKPWEEKEGWTIIIDATELQIDGVPVYSWEYDDWTYSVTVRIYDPERDRQEAEQAARVQAQSNAIAYQTMMRERIEAARVKKIGDMERINREIDTELDALFVFALKAEFTQEELKKEYKRLAIKYHPDKFGDAGHKLIQNINKAYRMLSRA